jgi:hypothetical protein
MLPSYIVLRLPQQSQAVARRNTIDRILDKEIIKKLDRSLNELVDGYHLHRMVHIYKRFLFRLVCWNHSLEQILLLVGSGAGHERTVKS